MRRYPVADISGELERVYRVAARLSSNHRRLEIDDARAEYLSEDANRKSVGDRSR